MKSTRWRSSKYSYLQLFSLRAQQISERHFHHFASTLHQRLFSLDPPKEQFFGEAEHPRKVSQRRYHPTSFPLLSSANLLLFSKARNNIPGHLFRKIRGKAAFQKASCFISVTFTNTHMHGLKKEEGTLWEKLQCPYMDLNQVCASSPVRLMRPTSKGDLLCFL